MNFFCGGCGAEYLKWEGKCRACGEWNTIRAAPAPSSEKVRTAKTTADPVSALGLQSTPVTRLDTGSAELNAIFGGGIAAGSVNLISGEPGVGKSTLLLMLASSLPGEVLYAAGEENLSQLTMKISQSALKPARLFLSEQMDARELVRLIATKKYLALCVDSVQTLYDGELDAPPGSPQAIKASAQTLIQAAKTSGVTLLLSGHINKAGDIAGPKLLEHMVDATFLMYNESSLQLLDLRVFRPLKNRFASVDGAALFVMEGGRLVSPTEQMLTPASGTGGVLPPGTVTYCHFLGKRALFSEIECLAMRAPADYGKRNAEGIPASRFQRIAAILEKYSGLDLSGLDLYLNLSGGIRNPDVHMDLSMAAALYAAIRGVAMPRDLLFLGEVGLGGGIRPVRELSLRLETLKRFGNFRIAANSTEPGFIRMTVFQDLLEFIKAMTPTNLLKAG